MLDPFNNLEKRVSELSNHLHKYIFTIKKHKGALIEDLDKSGKSMQVHLWHSSFSAPDEMRVITNMEGDTKRRVENLSCYYALQYLYMIFRNIDILALGIISGETQTDVYHQFLIQFGNDYRTLSQAYLENLLHIYLEGIETPEYFICSVGTRTDQDDIDLGIITEEGKDVGSLNHALQKITQNMLVYATPLHLHLSEHVGKQDYTTTISEYNELLQKRIQDVVIISEILNAKIISGSERLFGEFRKKVLDKYFFNPKKNIRFHEGFLRGILGEARAWLISPPQTDAISPKEDALRMLKSLLYAKKTILGIREVNPWDIISELKKKEPELKSEYELFSKALSFLEMFKFLMQLYIIQEETFRPEDLNPNQLNLLAERMGYKAIGTVSAWDQLIIDYYRYVKEVRRLCDFLMKNVTKHLREISLLIRMLGTQKGKKLNKKEQSDLVLNFIQNAQFYLGTKYWEDVLNAFKENPEILDEFIKGFNNLDESQQDKAIFRYIEWSRFTLITITRFITLIGRRQAYEIGDTLFQRMSQAFLEYIEKHPYTTERLCRIYSHYPEIIHEFLQLLPEPYFEYLDRILSKPVINERLAEYHYQLRELCNIHKWSGQYFHRFFYRVISNHPEYLIAITETIKISKISSGLLAMVDVYPDLNEKKKVLGAYYDLEFLRIGIGTMRGVELTVSNREFTEFCDNYMEALFDICSEEIENEFDQIPPSTDTFAILAAGGHARRQAYDDDYDLIAIVAEDDDQVLKHASKIMSRMNREILNRGLLSHYRLGEILGGFVNTFDQISKYLDAGSDDSFIDLSQLLGARMIIGSADMELKVHDKILKPFIFNRKTEYIERMIKEIKNREKINKERAKGTISLKETRGGLRDIEAIALVLKAFQSDTGALSETYFEEVKPKFEKISDQLDTLSESIYFLRTIRNLYRLMVSAEDKIQEHYLGRLGAVFVRGQHPEWATPKAIMERIQNTLEKSAAARDIILEYILKQASKS
jgi:hypothetical protein